MYKKHKEDYCEIQKIHKKIGSEQKNRYGFGHPAYGCCSGRCEDRRYLPQNLRYRQFFLLCHPMRDLCSHMPGHLVRHRMRLLMQLRGYGEEICIIR